ncbi:CPBP family intramembrane metalloprotease [Mesoplasma syrphidae]|uniref:CPBP family intramembrane metalloprotease n=1 Tax=Mesoplasma syrphidae TaxID=225999 RepID=A0A2K9BVR6_9MOLU|nr:CPBP family intramembrane glutamic endopeptidase [Mesoplasma syrphidae]AUF83810.1 CPBP family intramembrane metalloprotease [Mesoplasma syrphidae]
MDSTISSTKVNFWNKVQLPETNVDRQYGFLFKIYNPKTDGIIFIVTILLIPFISLFIFRFAFGMNPAVKDVNAWLPMANQGVVILSALIGGYVLYNRNTKLFVKTGLLTFYTFLLIPFIVAMIGMMIISVIPTFVNVNEEGTSQLNNWGTLLVTWFQIIGELVVIWIAFKSTTDLKSRVLETFKKNWRLLSITVAIGILIMVGICIFGYAAFASQIGLEESENQNTITGPLKDANSTFKGIYIFTLIIFTVLAAPIAEELACRHAIFVGVGNRGIAIFISAFYFGIMHVSNGDIENLLNYLIAGFILAITFSISRGNVTYTWLVHMGYNFTALMLIVAK